MRRKSRFNVGIATMACTLSATLVHAQSGGNTPLRERLDQSITCLFQDTHLSKVLEFIAEEAKVNILLDVKTDGRIEYLNLKRVTVSEALDAILKPLGLKYAVHNAMIRVYTPDKTKREKSDQLATRVFQLPGTTLPNCNAAIHQGTVAEVDLIAVLRRATPAIIEPETGGLLSYMRFNLETNQIVVHDTPENLQRLEALLELLIGEPI